MSKLLPLIAIICLAIIPKLIKAGTFSTSCAASTAPANVNLTTISKDVYSCPTNYAYLSYQDFLNNNQKVCSNLLQFGIYRLEAGVSARGSGYLCTAFATEPTVLGDAVCAKTNISDVMTVSSIVGCPLGYSTVSIDEANNTANNLCSKIGKWDVLRIGLRGSLSGQGYGCKLRAWDNRDLQNTLCVQRNIANFQLRQANENVCGTNKSLITAHDVLNNLQGYCKLVPAEGTVRLAGGASMSGSASGCQILNVDRTSLKSALCGSISRIL